MVSLLFLFVMSRYDCCHYNELRQVVNFNYLFWILLDSKDKESILHLRFSRSGSPAKPLFPKPNVQAGPNASGFGATAKPSASGYYYQSCILTYEINRFKSS